MKTFLLILICSWVTNAQVLLTPFGNSQSNGNQNVCFTSGEMVIATIEEGDQNITQGFQQPEIREVIELEIFNGLVHGDPNNNTFFIEELDQYPNNKILILNRWGDEVYSASPYENDWNGTRDGKMLPAATYYYIFYPDANSKEELHGNLYILNN